VATQDQAVELLHHEERGADKIVCAALEQRSRAREAALQTLKNTEFAAHVVAGFRLGARWRPAQDDFGTAHPQLEGQIAGTAGVLAQFDVIAGWQYALGLQASHYRYWIEQAFAADGP